MRDASARARVASPTIENSNRLIVWLRGMEGLLRALGLAR